MPRGPDLREHIFRDIKHRRITARIQVLDDGVIAGVKRAQKAASRLGLKAAFHVKDGSQVKRGQFVADLVGDPKSMAMAEDLLLGFLAKPSGIATACRRAVLAAEGKVKIVSHARKKIPLSMRTIVAEAVTAGGGHLRISDKPLLYLDKNYVRMFGSVSDTLKSTAHIHGRVRAVQLKGQMMDIATEALETAAAGADILMVDTGRVEDVKTVVEALEAKGLKHEVKVAFAGDMRVSDVPRLLDVGVDIIEIGRDILDAPMLDFRLDVTGTGDE
ncbi:MAG: hypothetical protein ACE5PO_03315 [Candidatus Bathyarchaeia archaeon]